MSEPIDILAEILTAASECVVRRDSRPQVASSTLRCWAEHFEQLQVQVKKLEEDVRWLEEVEIEMFRQALKKAGVTSYRHGDIIKGDTL